MTNRRDFVVRILPGAAFVLGASRAAQAEAQRLAESDPIAVALGYKHDASKVDKAKFARYAPGQNCANCQLYAAKPGEEWGACSAVGGKLVNAEGWCNAWVKKAAPAP